ncbi:hypothetical protein C8A03DRAFT_18887 [Achaetomium macrosporum]|uniref:Cytochrome b561 domain-containing protein n=1 Tax=Achaetomium macrosporum TaxID=79813 RepID=A0AAN7C2S0_9PEZI|nr:hypothetical protein C8A03DRAFT_18887 [Achaetomium macrosporum]
MAVLGNSTRRNISDVNEWFSLTITASAATAEAQRYSGYGPGNGYGSNPNYGNYAAYGNFDPEHAMRVRRIHGILAGVAMAAFFPTGSILMRVIPGRFALWAHALTQVAGLILLTVAVAMGLQLVQEVGRVGINLWDREDVNYHLIIGLVVLSCLMVQPVLGFIHHAKFKKQRRRQVWSYLHLFNGRIFITLGIINGALGLWIAREPSRYKALYLTAAVAMWSLWMLVAMFGEWRRWRERRKATGRSRKSSYDGDVPF